MPERRRGRGGAGAGAGGVAVVGAARGEAVVIVCEVDADPPAAVFKWKFNNSGETIDVAADRYTSNGSASSLKGQGRAAAPLLEIVCSTRYYAPFTYELDPLRVFALHTTYTLCFMYTPVADLDYGTLSCSASNEVGSQLAPCVFQMVAAGKPHAPRNCSLWNQTAESVEVACLAGFDGGLPQTFLLQVFSAGEHTPRRSAQGDLRAALIGAGRLMSTKNTLIVVRKQKHFQINLSSEEPVWTVRGLEWDVRFRLEALAVNGKGRSAPARLADVLFQDPEKRTVGSTLEPAPNLAFGATTFDTRWRNTSFFCSKSLNVTRFGGARRSRGKSGAGAGGGSAKWRPSGPALPAGNALARRPRREILLPRLHYPRKRIVDATARRLRATCYGDLPPARRDWKENGNLYAFSRARREPPRVPPYKFQFSSRLVSSRLAEAKELSLGVSVQSEAREFQPLLLVQLARVAVARVPLSYLSPWAAYLRRAQLPTALCNLEIIPF
ncbi:hypothetical protein MSG28_002578 [Choristoneura fumiferana]|uniref:Uncharacterized protein n=1 Tax=Choristoneura fumiferana TaxID=7141 RepID=A0ACC0JWG8_CHOFU|nr:hypothetical protein MSG28_002578 [Choristoneura fumiferana]